MRWRRTSSTTDIIIVFDNYFGKPSHHRSVKLGQSWIIFISRPIITSLNHNKDGISLLILRDSFGCSRNIILWNHNYWFFYIDFIWSQFCIFRSIWIFLDPFWFLIETLVHHVSTLEQKGFFKWFERKQTLAHLKTYFFQCIEVINRLF